MLSILFSTLILIPVFLGFGKITCSLFQIELEGISLRIILGMLSISILFCLLAFFVSLNIFVEVPFVVFGLGAFFYFRGYRGILGVMAGNRILFLSLMAIILFFGSFYPFILDHFGYYVPAISWISKVGLVKGISNLDLLLGQMSFWHILQAGFSSFTDSFLRLNSITLVIFVIYIFERRSWIHLAFLPILFLFSQSPSPDLPVIVFSLILLNEILLGNRNSTMLFLISVFIFSIKPTMIWLPVLSFLYSLFIVNSRLKFILPGTTLLFLFFFKNIWVFGFPIFPLQFLDFGFGWKPNDIILGKSADMAILKTYDLQYSLEEIRRFSLMDYVNNWLFLAGIKGIIHVLLILSLALFLVYAALKKSKLVWLIFISIWLKMIIVLWFSAQYRFFIDVFFVIFFVVFWQRISRFRSLMLFFILTFMVGLFFCVPKYFQSRLASFKMTGFLGGFVSTQFISPSVYAWKKYDDYQIGNLKFNMVNSYPFSFDTPIPAISPSFVQEYLDAGIFPQMKGSNLRDGFIWKKITPSERVDIQKILDLREHLER
ncbi:LIC_10190 family membrane protein [Chryseobacterium koreense]